MKDKTCKARQQTSKSGNGNMVVEVSGNYESNRLDVIVNCFVSLKGVIDSTGLSMQS